MKPTALLILALTLTACSDSSSEGNDGPGPNNKPAFVDWNSIPDRYNPKQEELRFELSGVKKIHASLFGFNKDFRIKYSKDPTSQNIGSIELFTVRSPQSKTFLSGADMSYDGSDLNIHKYGSYSCSIKTENRQIKSLSGACYVKVVLTLPAGAEVEVYNVGQLVSERFFAMDNATFLEELRDASFDDDKFEVIDEYLNSYRLISKRASLTSAELDKVLGQFGFNDGKLKALSKLHSFVSDRENLEKVIEDNFSYFDRDEARKIVGLK